MISQITESRFSKCILIGAHCSKVEI